MSIFLHSRRKSSEGAVLIIALVILSLVTVILVGLIVSMSMDRRMAWYYLSRTQAELAARDAVQQVEATLQAAITTNSPWVSGPGLLVVTTNGSSSVYPLTSGIDSNNVETNGPDLNRYLLTDQSLTAVLGATDSQAMRVKWVYVYQDGTRTNVFMPGTNNPVVSRYAYWADDETARINLNTAWQFQSGTTVSRNSPSLLSLTNIPGVTAAFATLIQSNALAVPFLSPDQARDLDPTLAEALSSNRFNTTFYSRSPDLNPWGEPKIILTTQQQLAEGTTNYLNILPSGGTFQNSDPGYTTGWSGASGSTTNLDVTINKLMTLMSRTNALYGRSFFNKYGTNGCIQIALDIVGYVRAVESTNQFITCLRSDCENLSVNFSNYPGSYYSWATPVGTNSLAETTRRPMFSELGVWFSPTLTNIGGVNYPLYTFKSEFYWPANQPAAINLNNFELALSITSDNKGHAYPTGDSIPYTPLSAANTTIGGGSAGTLLSPGGYAVVTLSQALTNYPGGFTAPSWITYRTILAQKINAVDVVVDIAPASSVNGTLVTNNIDAAGVSLANIHSLQLEDPRAGKFNNNWTNWLPNTFGSVNANGSTHVTAPVGQPPQDTNSSGAVYTQMGSPPPPKGSTANPDGIVHSVAELGFIPSGLTTNLPWRTIRLQPGSGSPPDWALLDFFTVPHLPTNNVNASTYWPQTNSLSAAAGLINLNTVSFPGISRIVPLEVLFGGATNLTTSASVIASNVASQTLAIGGTNYNSTNLFAGPGALAEIAGIADSGEDSEGVLRQVVDRVTAQGMVYRVFAVGQAVQPAPDGELLVNSEKYIVAVVEVQAPGHVRVLYWKELAF